MRRTLQEWGEPYMGTAWLPEQAALYWLFVRVFFDPIEHQVDALGCRDRFLDGLSDATLKGSYSLGDGYEVRLAFGAVR